MLKIAIIGAGASGMMCAINIKREDEKSDVTVFDSNSRVGKKLITTGNGRCNITNKCLDRKHFHSNDIEKAMNVIDRFNLDDTVKFFKSINIPIKDDGGNKLYPSSFQAQSLVDALRFECAKLGVNLICDTKIASIKHTNNSFILNDSYSYDVVVIATGGKAAPKLGSNGDGYKFLTQFGHKLVQPKESIVPIKTDVDFIKSAKGMKADVVLTLKSNKNSVSDFGEVLFTEYGISGPVALQISRFASVNKGVKAYINFMPDYNKENLLQEIRQRVNNCYENRAENLLLGLINKRIGFCILKKSGVSINDSADSLTDIQINNIAKNLQNFELEVKGVCGFENAQTTIGGIDLSDFNYNLQSKICKNLYACGEVLDVDGDCGGFNLQWAWSSGYVVAKSIVKSN